MNHKNLYIHKTEDNQYIVYNGNEHVPIKVTPEGLNWIKHHLSFDDDSSQFLPKDIDMDSYNEFISVLTNEGFFSIQDENIDNEIVFQKYDEPHIHFYLHLTNKCNLKCTYCYNQDMRLIKKELSYDEWEKILSKILPFSNKITLTGGEVTLFKDLEHIVKYIKSFSNNIEVILMTNGSVDFSQEKIKNVLLSIDVINMSCDNITDSNHERIGFNREIFLKNIELIEELNLTSKTIIASVWSKTNENYISKLNDFCIKENIFHDITLRLPLSKEEATLMPSIESHKRFMKNRNVNLDSDGENSKSIYTGKDKVVTCGAANTTFSIDALGDVYPCQSFHYEGFNLGNILSTTFEKIFQSPIAEMLRVANNVDNKEICKKCSLKYLCGGGCIADTYGLEKRLLAHPSVMCKYLKNGAIDTLERIEF